jgi:hypothetical protein
VFFLSGLQPKPDEIFFLKRTTGAVTCSTGDKIKVANVKILYLSIRVELIPHLPVRLEIFPHLLVRPEIIPLTC